ncbi:MAG: AAA family ATPase, partial [Candidatus Verstraetearchaeota archaeon]|nr:AAA family ATPase [Candidatus Verstraetearchaeota archaeon]
MPEELWVEKYKPKTLYDIVGNREEALRFGRWLEARLKGEKVKRAALLWGPPGTGKTLTVEVAARQYKLELI